MIKKILLFINTIRYLKPVQIYCRVHYFFLNRMNSGRILFSSNQYIPEITFLKRTTVYNKKSYDVQNNFTFLNISHHFANEIDWELMKYGKLWQYNLSYFDYLNQPDIDKEDGLRLIHDFINKQTNLKSAIEPYPISLRIINWIRFISLHHINDAKIIASAYVQVKFLSKRLEYHLLGNHLLENGFCLLHAGLFFKDKMFYNISKQVLTEQLNEQILKDGGHFELSPMYHQIILFRVLEAIDLLKNNYQEDIHFVDFLKSKASIMLDWLEVMTFHNGDIPLVNDAAFNIALPTYKLREISTNLDIEPNNISLSTSGYRKFVLNKYELLLDMGKVGPSYQPGHAHADIFNVIIYHNNKPFIIDTGTSTYEVNQRRQIERSTPSHNTVTVENQNQSQVWGGFRVAKRGNVSIVKDTTNLIVANHDGYKSLGVIHERKLELQEEQIIITDSIIGKEKKVFACFHFHPNIKFELSENQLIFENCRMLFTDFDKILIEDCYIAYQFNNLIPSKKVIIEFKKTLTTTISFDI